MSRKLFSNTNMIIVCLIFMALHILFYVDNAYGLMGKEDLINAIPNSLINEPDNWIDTGYYLVYHEDIQEVKKLRKQTWPEIDSEAQIVINYNFYPPLIYVNLKLPFKHDFHGDIRKKIITNIKLFKLNILQKEVGYLLNKPERVKKQATIKKEQTNEKKGLKKL